MALSETTWIVEGLLFHVNERVTYKTIVRDMKRELEKRSAMRTVYLAGARLIARLRSR